jgi:predicted PhzF superfamily epimerase YddE/YHI9
MATLHVLRVFTDADGGRGNPLGVFLDGAEVAQDRRQAVARALGFSETVFVDGDPAEGRLRILTPEEELPFAGHPTVGTAWLLGRERAPVDRLRVPAGEVEVRYDGELTWVAGRPEWPSWVRPVQLESAAEVEALRCAPVPDVAEDCVYCWAWEDEAEGSVRSRAFFPGFGIAEDEATGAAAIVLCGDLGRPIDVRQGRGSELFARPREDGAVEVGGRCRLDEVRDF